MRLHLITLGWLAGLLLGGLDRAAPDPGLGLSAWLACGALGLAGLVWALSRPRHPMASQPGAWSLCAAALCAGFACASARSPTPPYPPAGLARLEVEVERVWHGRGQQASARLRVLSGTRLLDSEPIAAGTQLWAGPRALPVGARLRVLGQVSARAPFRNISPHTPLPGPRAQGALWLPHDAAWVRLDPPGLAGQLEAARSRLRRRLRTHLPEAHAAMARALLLGDGGALREETRQSVRDAGLAHVLAVSGLHVALLAGMAVLLLRLLFLRIGPLSRRYDAGRLAAAAGVPLVLLYAAFAGGAPSAWRAAITAALCWGLVAVGRKPSVLAVASLAVLLLSAAAPQDVWRPGFLLSVSATAAILSGPAQAKQGLLRGAWRTTWRASLATAPLVIWCFGALPPVGLVANILLLPVGAGLLLPLAALVGASVSLLPWSTPMTAGLFALASDAFVNGCRLLAEALPPLQPPPPDNLQGALLVCACTLLLLSRTLRSRALIVGLAGLALLAAEARLRWREQPHSALRVTFLDVGQGDAALIDFPDGRCMLIDAGGNPGGGPDPGERVLLPLLRARRRDHLDVVALSHPHPDHYGGLGALVNAVSVGELWDSGQSLAERDLSPTAHASSELLQRFRERGARVRTPASLCGPPRNFGAARVQVLAPCPGHDTGLDANDNSLVIRLEYGAHSVLFTGDVEALGEAHLLRSGHSLAADIFKVPHHGSRTSSGVQLLRAVRPWAAVVSAGMGNRFDHPHPDVRGRLEHHADHVFDLSRSGGLIVTSDGKRMDLRSWSGRQLELGAPRRAGGHGD